MLQLRQTFRLGLAGLLAFAAPALAQEGQMPPKQVGVVALEQSQVPQIVTLPSRAVSAAEVAIRPRVSGLVTEIIYKPGAAIKKGEPMFRIDTTTYEANLSSARAEVASAKAAVTQTKSAYDRAAQLVRSGTSEAQVEVARATWEQAQASLEAAEAKQKLAEVDLDWTTVTSPIDGMASVAEVSVGDLVSAGQAQELATVTQLDPIEVDMYEPSARMMSVINDIQSGRMQVSDSIRATLTLETGETYHARGELVAPGFTVSTSTGAVDTRFRFENPNNVILPGMFLRGQVEIGSISAVLVSQSAATRDKTGKLSAWVVVDGKAQQRELTEVGVYQNNWTVVDGVKAGEMLAVDGLSGLTEGQDVVTVPVAYDEQGVVREAAPAADAAQAAPAADASQPTPEAASESAPGEEAPAAEAPEQAPATDAPAPDADADAPAAE